MRAPLAALLTILIVNAAVDAYIYFQARRRCHNPLWSRAQLVLSVFFAVTLVAVICLPARSGSDTWLLSKMWLLFAYLSFYLPKYVAVVADLIASVPRLWHKKRCRPLTVAGITLGIVIFGAMWWGALINRFNIQTNEVEVKVDGLPEAFDGMKILQFSDLHTGTLAADTTYVSHLVDEINAATPDLILFTGDIVNRHSSELEPFVQVLARLRGPEGKYAILGNHDYGDYMKWDSDSLKQENLSLLYRLYDRTGLKLLRNETAWLRRGNDSIALIGVENIGDPPFKTYGSLAASYPDITDGVAKILLTHNPQHWVDSISSDPGANIALTLSGHTHAMQIEVAGITPAAIRYPTWGGLYADPSGKRKLYVNIGCGTVGLPMRVGATPELTLITLRAAR